MTENIKVITGNPGKFKDIQLIIPNSEQVDIDLPEIQSLDPQEIIGVKLRAAREKLDPPFMLEDTSLSIAGMNGLPGTLVKWFLETVGPEGIYKISTQFADNSAEALTIIGYVDAKGEEHFFEGISVGKIVSPKGSHGFGWGSIFFVEELGKTYAELPDEEKVKISMRTKALMKLKDYLQ